MVLRDPEVQALLDERALTMQDFSADHRPFNLYAIYRADLQMSPAKMAAQCGHAYQLSLEKARERVADIDRYYKGTGNGTKLCMYVKNEGQLLRAYVEARELGLPCAVVIDRGHVIPGTAFDGNPIVTAVGIGPCYKDLVSAITKRCTMAP